MSAETTGQPITLATAQFIAARLRIALEPYCDRIDIAGSVRRRRPNCNDIDLVLLLKEGRRESLEARVRRHPAVKVLRSGAQVMSFLLPESVQVDLFFATPPSIELFTTTPTNYGMRLLAMTGSKEHNVKLAKLAKSQGVHFHPYKGLMRGGEYVCIVDLDPSDPHGQTPVREEYRGGEVFASATEEEIFAALGLPLIPPEWREA